MDTAKLLLRQLRAAANFADGEAPRKQIEWWRARVEELREQQPMGEAAAVEPLPTTDQARSA